MTLLRRRIASFLAVALVAAVVAVLVGPPSAHAGQQTIRDPKGDAEYYGDKVRFGDITWMRVRYSKKQLKISTRFVQSDLAHIFQIKVPGRKAMAYEAYWDNGDGESPHAALQNAYVRNIRTGTDCRVAARYPRSDRAVTVYVPTRCLRVGAKVPGRVKVRQYTINQSSNVGDFDDRTRWTRWVKRG